MNGHPNTLGEVVDKPDRRRFELAIGSEIAFVDYRRDGAVLTLTHAEVPDALSGQGLGSKLARSTLDLIRTRREKIIPQCAFIAAFVRRNPAYRDLLAE
ncbi:MAG: N-acetyltransferase [Alphaproteobacteria bacterium]|nr:N-acetyltransferase [Alphaproteobacteria bacterium]